MWVEKTKTGYRLVERYTDVFGVERKASVSFKSKGDKRKAQEALFERIGGLVKKDSIFRPELTFGSLSEKYLAWKKNYHKEQTYVEAVAKFKTLRRLIGDDLPVKEMTAPYIRNALQANPTRYNDRLKSFKAMIRWAYREELLDDISFIDRLPKMKEPPIREKVRWKYLESDELKLLLASMEVEKNKNLTEFLALTGLRIGEALALTDKDIDLDERVIHVNKTFSLMTQKISSTKTEASDRDVFIQEELLSLLKRIKISKRVFDIPYEGYAKYFRENTERIIGRRLSPHALRHTHVALLAENGVPLDAIARRLGHADSDVTKDIYYHVTKKVIDAENRLLDKVSILD